MDPGTTLLATFAALAAGFAVALWGGGMFAQGYFYNEPARWMLARAIVGGILLGGFFTFWTYLNTRAESKDRYGTLFEFNPTATKEYAAFDAVRRYGLPGGPTPPAEKVVAFKRAGGRAAKFVEVGEPAKEFVLTTADYITVAMEIPDGDGKARFDADLDAKGKYASASNKVFRAGTRFLEFGQTNTPGAVQVPSRGAFWGALFLNVANVLVWFVVLWPVMRFQAGHAGGLACVLAAACMFLMMPLLFEKNKVRAAGVAVPAATVDRPSVGSA